MENEKNFEVPYYYQNTMDFSYNTSKSNDDIKKKQTKNHQKSIYFAHPHDKKESIEKKIIVDRLKELGYKVVRTFIEEKKLEEKYGGKYSENPSRSFARDIEAKDFRLIKNSDEFFGWFIDKVCMIGAPIEFEWAFWLKKPITVICYWAHPFLVNKVDKFYLTIQDFVMNKEFILKE